MTHRFPMLGGDRLFITRVDDEYKWLASRLDSSDILVAVALEEHDLAKAICRVTSFELDDPWVLSVVDQVYSMEGAEA